MVRACPHLARAILKRDAVAKETQPRLHLRDGRRDVLELQRSVRKTDLASKLRPFERPRHTHLALRRTERPLDGGRENRQKR